MYPEGDIKVTVHPEAAGDWLEIADASDFPARRFDDASGRICVIQAIPATYTGSKVMEECLESELDL